MSIPLDPQEIELLRRDKYAGNKDADMSADLERLAKGEPLAYVIGWLPFLGLKIGLDSKPLIPRPETEWWTEKLIEHLKYRFGDTNTGSPSPFRLLDLCAGSGSIGLAMLSHLPSAHVSFGELEPSHAEQIEKNLTLNKLDARRADIQSGNLFEPFADQKFDIIVTNPPYITEGRALDTSVTEYEPSNALFAGHDGLDIIRKIIKEAPKHLSEGGELWMECDIDNIAEAEDLVRAVGADETTIDIDLYGRPRLLIAHFA